MSSERFKSREKGVDINIVSNIRILMVFAVSAILASGCQPKEQDVDKDLAGVENEPDTNNISNNISKEYLAPVAQKDTDPIIICEELDSPDGGQAEPDKSYQELYDKVVETLRVKNGRVSHKHK